MQEEPSHIGQRELAGTLHGQWGLAPAGLRYLPVGFGDYHWELTDAAGGRWFVTVAELAGGWRGASPAAGYADLRAAMETVIALRQAGLEFAVAPVPTAGGQALAPLGSGNAVTVFPYLDAAPGEFGGEMTDGDRLALIGILARLHDATPLAPQAAPAREAARGGPAVITHGEPHPGNILRGAGGLHLIDWDTVGLALPERDLWMVAGDDARAAGRYAELTGRQVSGVAMQLYRLRWSLDDIALFLREVRGPHEQDEDTELAWEALNEEIGELG